VRRNGDVQPGQATAWRERFRDAISVVPGLRSRRHAVKGAAFEIGRGLNLSERRALVDRKVGVSQQEIPQVVEWRIEQCLKKSVDWLLGQQNRQGFWVAELEADTTLESYFILGKAFFGHLDDPKIPKYAKVIREAMLPDGGWSIFANGPVEISVSVLSYFALKIAGISADEPDMRRTRNVILSLGGATSANTYTKYHLAFFEQYDWDHVPAIPPEIIFIPTLSPINIYEMSSWSRTIFVPLSILYALKPVCPLPRECNIDELFVGGREHADLSLPRSNKKLSWINFFLLTDKALKIAEKFPIQKARKAAIKRAERWMVERFEASGGLGAILPAMMNSVLAMKCLGYADDHPVMAEGLRQLNALEIEDSADNSIRIQPCHSPVWDTAISVYALAQAGIGRDNQQISKAIGWLLSKEVKRPGDWQVKNPVPPGGWYFEFENEFYPDVDDTIMVMMGMRLLSPEGFSRPVDEALKRALIWVLGMQNESGGWASFDRNNENDFLTKVPFADHNAMIDPATADITSRVLEMLATVAPETYTMSHPTVKRAIDFLKKDQCADGSWFGRWGVNYFYGTWQVLRGLRLIGEDMSQPYVRKAVDWILSVQQEDGGWGERADTYTDPSRKGLGPSTPSQTAWALMGLLAAGMGDDSAVRSGIDFLLGRQRDDGSWDEEEWTGTGFPKVFYLKYHYYRHYWPLMALAQYGRHLKGLRP
jgi:squalene-hopene/tetraprenyl-beta-curcumene cyclase